jgi:fructuronate reductase
VIEDDVVDGDRPNFAVAGAELMADVRPQEARKLQMLNGAHSALACLGRLAGRATAGEAATDPALARFLDGLWREELAPSVTPPPGADLAAYARDFRARFATPRIRPATAQIAADGSRKLPGRLLAPARDLLDGGRPIPQIALAVAAWMRLCAGRDDAGGALPLDDPLAETIRRRIDAAGRTPWRRPERCSRSTPCSTRPSPPGPPFATP